VIKHDVLTEIIVLEAIRKLKYMAIIMTCFYCTCVFIATR